MEGIAGTRDLALLLSPMQAARRAGLTPNRMRQLTDAGQLEHVRTACGRLIDGASLDAWIAGRQRRKAQRAASRGR